MPYALKKCEWFTFKRYSFSCWDASLLRSFCRRSEALGATWHAFEVVGAGETDEWLAFLVRILPMKKCLPSAK